MKVMKASKEHICSKCGNEIEERTEYWSTSYNDYCMDCGNSKRKGNSDITIAKTAKCKYCSETAVNLIHDTPTCDTHIGEVIKP